eukprot:7459417-Alexandrium_andersonii.AAC.1
MQYFTTPARQPTQQPKGARSRDQSPRSLAMAEAPTRKQNGAMDNGLGLPSPFRQHGHTRRKPAPRHHSL